MRQYPHADPAKKSMTRMGSSEPARFLITEHSASIWAPVKLPAHTAGKIKSASTSSRKRRDWMVDILMSPPSPPFLAVSLGMAASDVDHWRYTVSEELIVFSGAAAGQDGINVLTVDRQKFLAAKDWFTTTKTPVSDLLRARDIKARFQRGVATGAATREALSRIKTSVERMSSYPGVDDERVMKIAAYAANEWVSA